MLISLVREHTEQMNPPRALWVPFDLGRPMGAPDEPEFQRRVLETALGLLARTHGPVLEDFPEDALGSRPDDMSGWVCPVNFPRLKAEVGSGGLRQELASEMAALQPWYDLNFDQKGRTIVGVGGINISDCVKLVVGFLKDQTIQSPRDDRPLAQMLKFSAEDLKAWYIEAATAQPGGSGREIADWFWGETAAGKALLQMTSTLRRSENKGFQALGAKGVVPRSHENLLS